MRNDRSSRRIAVLLTVGALMVGVMATPAVADGHIEMRIAFDESRGQLPEGVAVDKVGNVFVSIAPLGQLWKITPGSTTPELFGSVSGIDPSADFGLLGLAVDARGNVYGTVQSANPDANGVWRFHRRTGVAMRIAGSEQTAMANDLAFDKRGNLYVTDSILGAIWIKPKRGDYQPWLVDDPNLAGTGALGLPIPIGANGIEYRKGTLYVTVSEQFSVVEVDIEKNGGPGASSVIATIPPDSIGLPGITDGLAIDVHGNLFVAVIAQSAVVRIDKRGNVTTVASGDPLDWTSSVAFGTGKGDRKTLFAVNFSIGEGNGDPLPRVGPGLVAIDVGVAGQPLP